MQPATSSSILTRVILWLIMGIQMLLKDKHKKTQIEDLDYQKISSYRLMRVFKQILIYQILNKF